MSNLRPCPFCGSTKLKIDKKSKLVGHNGLDDRVEQHTFSVRCNVCHARGGAAGGKVLDRIRKEFDVPSWATTDEEIKNRAIEAWNSRAGGKLICQINVDGEEILRKALDKTEVDGKTLAEWMELAKGYEQLKAELATVKRERDAALSDFKSFAQCKNNICHYCAITGAVCGECGWKYPDLFVWRGVCKENTEVQGDD